MLSNAIIITLALCRQNNFHRITCTNDKIQSKSTFNYYVFLDNPLVNIFVMNFSSLYRVKMSISLAVFTLSLIMITHGRKLKTKNHPKSIRISHFRREIKLSLDVFRIKLINLISVEWFLRKSKYRHKNLRRPVLNIMLIFMLRKISPKIIGFHRIFINFKLKSDFNQTEKLKYSTKSSRHPFLHEKIKSHSDTHKVV